MADGSHSIVPVFTLGVMERCGLGIARYDAAFAHPLSAGKIRGGQLRNIKLCLDIERFVRGAICGEDRGIDNWW